jgi:hypothetical protein
MLLLFSCGLPPFAGKERGSNSHPVYLETTKKSSREAMTVASGAPRRRIEIVVLEA